MFTILARSGSVARIQRVSSGRVIITQSAADVIIIGIHSLGSIAFQNSPTLRYYCFKGEENPEISICYIIVPARYVHRHMSSFAHVEAAPPDAVFNLSALYKQDPHPDKVDLGIGGALSARYRDGLRSAPRGNSVQDGGRPAMGAPRGANH